MRPKANEVPLGPCDLLSVSLSHEAELEGGIGVCVGAWPEVCAVKVTPRRSVCRSLCLCACLARLLCAGHSRPFLSRCVFIFARDGDILAAMLLSDAGGPARCSCLRLQECEFEQLTVSPR